MDVVVGVAWTVRDGRVDIDEATKSIFGEARLVLIHHNAYIRMKCIGAKMNSFIALFVAPYQGMFSVGLT